MNSAESKSVTPFRSPYIDKIRQDEKEVSIMGEKLFGHPCHMVCGTELEGVAVLPEGVALNQFPLNKAVRASLFPDSPSVARVLREEVLDGHTDTTHDDHVGLQIEFVIRHRTSPAVRCRPIWELVEKHTSSQGKTAIYLQPGNMVQQASTPRVERRIPPTEMARILSILPRLVNANARNFGLERVDFSAVPFISKKDQTSGIHANISFEDTTGKNLFENENGKASPLLLCFILELLESDKEATAFFAPTPDAFERFNKQFAAPHSIGLTDKRGRERIASMMIQGAEYKTRRDPDDDIPPYDPDMEDKSPDKGGTRLEHRLPCPEVVTTEPEKMPYILMRYYLAHLKLALKRYDRMKEERTLETLDEQAAMAAITEREIQRKQLRLSGQPYDIYTSEPPLARSYPFPENWNEAIDKFEKSARLKEVLGEDHAEVLRILAAQKEKKLSTKTPSTVPSR